MAEESKPSTRGKRSEGPAKAGYPPAESTRPQPGQHGEPSEGPRKAGHPAEPRPGPGGAGAGAAARRGAQEGAEAAGRLAPEAGNLVTRAVYGGCYVASFGVVFGALVASRLVPGRHAAAGGLEDGARAAWEMLQPGESRPDGRTGSV